MHRHYLPKMSWPERQLCKELDKERERILSEELEMNEQGRLGYYTVSDGESGEAGMKRAGIFIILGPAIGALLLFAAGMVVQDQLNRPAIVKDLVLLGWLWGIVPACLCGLVDWLLSRRLAPILRASAMALVGFVVTALVVLLGGLGVWPAVLAGLVGILPAAICSWLSGEKQDAAMPHP